MDYASGQSATRTETQARDNIAPWYRLFNMASRVDVRTIREQVLIADSLGSREVTQFVSDFSNSIPDMTFEIKEVLVTGDRIIVREEVTGMPAGELFGVPHAGKSFRMIELDLPTVKDGKIAKTYHLKNWLSALGQLGAK